MHKDNSTSVSSNIFCKNLNISDEFKKQVLSLFGVTPERLESAAQVNNWCAEHTNNRIMKIVDQIVGDCIIISAIYFKADWFFKFDKTQTALKKFEGVKQKVDMMSIKSQFDYF